MRGIDVSKWNKESDIRTILSDEYAEIDFIIAKHSEGLSLEDSKRDAWRKLALEHNKTFSLYHFFNRSHMRDEAYVTSLARRLSEMSRDATAATIWIDWERDYSKESLDIIMRAVRVYEEECGHDSSLKKLRVGIYANYSTLMRRDFSLSSEGKTLARYLSDVDMPIWCARYRKQFAQPCSYLDDSTYSSCMQTNVDGIPCAVNQITTRTIFNGKEYSLDYNIAYRSI